MMKLSNRVRGEVQAEIFGVFPEAVVNRCSACGVRLRQVAVVDGQTLCCTVDESDLEYLRKLCQRSQCELRVIAVRGGSHDRRLLKRRIWLPVTALLMAGILLLSSLFVWDIEIRGNERLSRGTILRALADAGLERASFWPGLSADLLRSCALSSLPDCAWLTVNVSGSRAVVLVKEREAKPEIYAESAACSLSASHTGIVRRVSVLNGRALVSPGQAVQKGETLILGELNSLTGKERFVRSRGEIWADTWYELTAVCPPASYYKGETGGTIRRFALVVGEKRINFYGKSRKTLDGYDKIMHDYNLGIEGLFALPLRLVCESWVHRQPGTFAGDARAMEARLERYLQEQIDGTIQSRTFSVLEKDGAVYVTMRAQCFENIATITQAEDSSP